MPSDRSRISRQFTSSELALDDRTSNFLEQPPISGAIGGSMGQTYHWMKQDLEQRSMMSEQLGRETAMAFSQSERHELARQAQDLEADKEQAIGSFKRVTDLTRNGKDFRTAMDEVVADTPGLALNKHFVEQATEFGKFHEDNGEAELRHLKTKGELMDIGSKNFSLENFERFRQENPDAADRMVGLLGKNLENQELNAANAGVAAHVEQIKRSREWDEQKKIQSEWDGHALGNSDDPVKAADSEAALHYSFAKSGLAGVEDPKEVVKQFGAQSSVAGMLANKTFLDEKLQTPEARQQLVEAINLSTDKDADPKAKMKARGFLLTLAGENQAKLADTKLLKERMAAIDATDKELGGVYKDSSAAITAALALKNGTEPADDSAKIPAIIAAGQGFLDRFRALSEPGTDKLFDDYAAHFAAMADPDPKKNGYTTAKAVASQAQVLMGHFIADFKKASGVVSQKKTTADPNKEALDWLKANPNDSRAPAIRAKLGLK